MVWEAEDDLIAGADAGRTQGDVQPIGGVGEAQGMACAGEGRQVLLEVAHVLLGDEGAAAGICPGKWRHKPLLVK